MLRARTSPVDALTRSLLASCTLSFISHSFQVYLCLEFFVDSFRPLPRSAEPWFEKCPRSCLGQRGPGTKEQLDPSTASSGACLSLLDLITHSFVELIHSSTIRNPHNNNAHHQQRCNRQSRVRGSAWHRKCLRQRGNCIVWYASWCTVDAFVRH